MIKQLIESFKGFDGQFSSRRITAFWFVVLTTLAILSLITLVFLMLFGTITLTDYSIKTAELIITLIKILCVMILLLFGVVTAQQIINFRTANPSPPSIVQNADTVNVDKKDEN